MRRVGPDLHASQEHENQIFILICGHLAQDPYFHLGQKSGARFDLRVVPSVFGVRYIITFSSLKGLAQDGLLDSNDIGLSLLSFFHEIEFVKCGIN